MKTVRLLFLLVWALAHVMPRAGAHPFKPVQCAQVVAPILPAVGLSTKQEHTRTFVLNEAVRAAGEDFTQVALQKARGAADVWRDFATEWLLSRKILWIGMFLLLLLLARL